MKNKKKQRKRYTQEPRLDFRQGGRVPFNAGQAARRAKEAADAQEAEDQAAAQAEAAARATQEEKEKTPPSVDPDERRERIARTTETVEASARGEVPPEAVIPPAQQVDEGIKADVKQLSDSDLVKATAGTATATQQAVTQAGPSQRAEVPDDVPPVSKVTDVKKVDTDVTFESATGTLSEGAIPVFTEATLTKAATGVTVEDEDVIASLTPRVVGTIDPETKAEVVKVAGTNLPRVLRAKKQLRRAGLSEDVIAELGNDPEVLEERLMDLTEEERGMIEGLPEEALVSTQLDTLLSGIEEGEIPTWAKPAVAAVNQVLAQRGLSASTVGRDNLFNAIIQSAVPLAQSNAQAIKESVLQQRGIEAQAELQNAQMAQQRALNAADKVFNLNMAQFSADQNQKISNSKFLQTVTMTEASNAQQAIMQEAVSMAQLDLANLDANTKLAAQTAQAFLQMDMANLTNDQQGRIITAQQEQQRMLSNQAAENAAKQFNAASQNQRDQFMANLSTQVSLSNAARNDAMEQFNAAQANAAAAANANRAAEISRINAQLETQINQYNAQQEFAKNQFNVQNAQAIEQANTQWRRQANTINTAAQNAINQQNAQNAFAMSTQAQAFLWQELRDEADFAFKRDENELQRKASLTIAALGNDGLIYKGRNISQALRAVKGVFGGYTSTPSPDPDEGR